MEYTLLKGTFKPSDPDGDSVHFMPNKPELLRQLPRRNRRRYPNIKRCETVKIRYEGIDTLETDYRSENQGCFAEAATNKNLEFLKEPNQNSHQDGETQGYILAHLCGRYGRPIAFAFIGGTERADGTRVQLDVDEMQRSVNFQMIQSGFAYPCFYSTLAADLRAVMAAAVDSARKDENIEFWIHDHTQQGVEWQGPDLVSNLQPIFPKLWRRLVKYSKDGGDTLDAFIDYLRFQIDIVYIISESQFTTLDRIVTVDNNTLNMVHVPEDLIFA